MSHRPNTSAFLKLFNSINPYGNRYDVFRDFVTMSAIELHNRLYKYPKLEAEYIATAKRYDQPSRMVFGPLFRELVKLVLHDAPADILGRLFMELDFGNERVGQFFTPPALSDLIAHLTIGNDLKATLQTEDFITVSEPACGAGGMILSFAKAVGEAGYNPNQVMWTHCQDVDRTAALMCYVQLSLWDIPGVVVVGNTLAGESRERFYTLAHWAGFWNVKLKRRDREDGARELLQQPTKSAEPKEPKEPEAPENMPETASGQNASSTPSPTPKEVSRIPSPLKIQASFDFDL